MNSNFGRDEESLTGGESTSTLSSHHVLVQNSGHHKVKKLLVTIGLLFLVGFVAAAVGCGIVFTESPEMLEKDNHLKCTFSTQNFVKIILIINCNYFYSDYIGCGLYK